MTNGSNKAQRVRTTTLLLLWVAAGVAVWRFKLGIPAQMAVVVGGLWLVWRRVTAQR